MMIRKTFISPGNSLGVLFLVLLYLSGWGTDNSYGMAMAIPDNNINNLVTSSGLTVDEEGIFRSMIDGIVTNNKKTWYSEDFSPEEHVSSASNMDLKEVLKIMSLTESSMEVVKMVDARIQKIVSDKKKKMGMWGIQVDSKIPYRISSNSHNLLLEIKKHDCLMYDGVTVPTNDTTEIPNSVWLGYSDSIYVPFNCPRIKDFDREEALKDLQKLQARTSSRRKRETSENTMQVNIVQVNLTITSQEFDNTLKNINSQRYIKLTSDLTTAVADILNKASNYKGVNDFSFRAGSVIASFHVEFTGSNSVATVQEMLKNATSISGTLGGFTVNTSLSYFGQVPNDNGIYTSWQQWGECSKTCGTGQQTRRRTCNSTAPLACAHLGYSEEKQNCYKMYCPDKCGGVFVGDRGNFSSPVVNGVYPAGAQCVWRINVDKNHTVVVRFKDFDLEEDKKCYYDYVAFYDGDYSLPSLPANKQLMRFCGNSTPPRAHPPFGYPINSSDSDMTVYFKTDLTKERKGFTVEWYKVLKIHLRVSSMIPQELTTLSLIYNPWSTTKGASIPIGKATTCPESLGQNDCYFEGKQTIISRITSLFLNREFEIESSRPVFITFEHILDEEIFPGAYVGRKTCVTWDHSIKSPRYGAWTRRGCYASFSNLTHTFCKCRHTGVFAVLGETEMPSKNLNLKGNTYFGIAVSLLFVIITVHSLATKQKCNTGELFHLFETLVSGVLIVIFLTGAHVPAEKALCGFLAFFLYYLVLSQFTWMLLTVLWIQNLLKRFLSERVKINIIYFVLGWGVPLVLAGVAGKVDIDQHGNKDNVCWVSIAGTGTVWGYGAPVFVMLMINLVVLAFLLMPKSKQNYDYEKMRPRILKEILIMFFFLMTWVLGVKVVLDDSFRNQYFFCFFLIMQGVVNYNVCFETTEQFWKVQEVKAEKQAENDEDVEKSQEIRLEEKQVENKINEQPRMTVKTLKNLNIYKENGVFVIEA